MRRLKRGAFFGGKGYVHGIGKQRRFFSVFGDTSRYDTHGWAFHGCYVGVDLQKNKRNVWEKACVHQLAHPEVGVRYLSMTWIDHEEKLVHIPRKCEEDLHQKR